MLDGLLQSLEESVKKLESIFNQLESKYKFDNLSVGLEDNVLIIEFFTSNLKDGINLIADTANHIEKDVLSLSITKKGDSNNITAKFNI